MSDMAVLNVQSAVLRGARAKIRRDLVSGATTIADLLNDPPPEIQGVTVLDLLKMRRGQNADVRGWQHRLGQAALRDRVNVLITVGAASQRTRDWASVHGVAYTKTSRKAVA